MQSVLNVRMDSSLKERGDKVLSENGISVSCAVRALWSQLASTRSLPDFLKAATESEQEKQAKRVALDRLAAISSSSLDGVSSDAQDQSAMMESMYDQMWAEYEDLQ